MYCKTCDDQGFIILNSHQSGTMSDINTQICPTCQGSANSTPFALMGEKQRPVHQLFAAIYEQYKDDEWLGEAVYYQPDSSRMRMYDNTGATSIQVFRVNPDEWVIVYSDTLIAHAVYIIRHYFYDMDNWVVINGRWSWDTADDDSDIGEAVFAMHEHRRLMKEIEEI